MNSYTLRLENANDTIIKIFNSIASELGAKLKIKKRHSNKIARM